MTPRQRLDSVLRQDYKLWDNAHAKMKDNPPPEGRDYLKHASNLLTLLQGVSELHPIAKAVITTFQSLVGFEQDRRENDARVTAVFLAQTDMMCILLDVKDLRQPDSDSLRSTVMLGDILLRIQKEIKSCGNSIDTYYKESRFVKFWKAQDWKNRMLGYITEFNQYRHLLQQTLSIQVASGVQDLVSTMDVVLSRLFAPKHDWERDLDIKTRGLGPGCNWVDDRMTLQALVAGTRDPSLDISAPTVNTISEFTAEVQLNQVAKELQLSLEILCEKNMSIFELKLNFHMQQVHESIINSAQFVIQSLSGPHSRLFNEDLRQLWKEMNWIFCVENRFFSSALFEYYLDRFASKNSAASSVQEIKATDTNFKYKNPQEQMKFLASSAPKSTFLSGLGALDHPDAWTLEYIAQYGDRITAAIDTDNSGFIRISEANAFSQQTPKGWTLPQWCAYSAAGWAYEARIYRKRINHILLKISEMQASVLSSNRALLFVWEAGLVLTICHAFVREPIGQKNPNMTPELRDLVKEKVIAQDITFRGHLASLNWLIDDESTLRLLYGDRPPETYILQLCALMLEHAFQLIQACCKVTLDIKEGYRLLSAFCVVRQVSRTRLSELSVQSGGKQEAAEVAKTHWGGIWSFLILKDGVDLSQDLFARYTQEEVIDHLSDVSLLDDFPLPLLPAMSLPYLHYMPWEDFVKTLKEEDIPSKIPNTWSPLGEPNFSMERTKSSEFPVTGWFCDKCEIGPHAESRYSCLTCNDTDLCIRCVRLPEEEHTFSTHTYQHPLMYSSMFYMPDQSYMISAHASIIIEKLQQAYNAQRRSDFTIATNVPSSEESQDEEVKSRVVAGAGVLKIKCARCSEVLSAESTIHRCIGHSCQDYFLCEKCAYERQDAPADEHQWWHFLMVLRKDILEGRSDTKPPVQIEIATAEEASPDAGTSQPVSEVQVRISKIENKLDLIHATLEDRVTRLESKIDNTMTELKDLLGVLSRLSGNSVPVVASVEKAD